MASNWAKIDPPLPEPSSQTANRITERLNVIKTSVIFIANHVVYVFTYILNSLLFICFWEFTFVCNLTVAYRF